MQQQAAAGQARLPPTSHVRHAEVVVSSTKTARTGQVQGENRYSNVPTALHRPGLELCPVFL